MYSFFAMLFRQRFLYRWPLMKNTEQESVSQHSLEVASIAHALALIQKKCLGLSVSPEKAALYAIYHDASEVFTGDLPTPIKYFNDEMSTAYKKLEDVAQNRLLSLLPDYLRDEYEAVFSFENGEDKELRATIKAADKLAALIKCINEINSGNREFARAKETLERTLDAMNREDVRIFRRDFIDSFYLTLDDF